MATGMIKKELKWDQISVTAVNGTLSGASFWKTSGFVYATFELTGPVSAYTTFLNGFPAINSIYYGEGMNTDASVRKRFYIAHNGEWFLREALPENQMIRVSVVVPLC